MSGKIKKSVWAAFICVFFSMMGILSIEGGESGAQFNFPPDGGGTRPLLSTDGTLTHGVWWKQGMYNYKDHSSQVHGFEFDSDLEKSPGFTTYYRCKYTDLRFFTMHSGQRRWGIKFRLIVPENLDPNIEYPLYLVFDYKATEKKFPKPNLMRIAEEGIIVATTSMRGHIHAYKKGDPLYGQSDWKGSDEMMDFDCLLWCFINGHILNDFPGINPARIGIGGGSMGGITTFVYGRWTQIPGETGHKIRVAMPGGCAPSMGDWFAPGLDPVDRLNWDNPNISTLGAMRLSGLAVQVAAFWQPKCPNPHEFWEKLVDWMEGDVNGDDPPTDQEFQKFEEFCEYRSGYDNYQPNDYTNLSVNSFLNNVDYGLLRIGCQDSVMPRSPIYDFFKKLNIRADDPNHFNFSGHFRLISPVGYHLGTKKHVDDDGYMAIPPDPADPDETAKDYGYFPRCTFEMKRKIEGWSFTQAKEFLVHYLVDASLYPDVETMPDWLCIFVDDTRGPLGSINKRNGQDPPVYYGISPAHGTEPTGWEHYSLKETTGSPDFHELSQPSSTIPPLFEWDVDLSYGGEECNTLDFIDEKEDIRTAQNLRGLCRPDLSGADYIRFISEPLTDDLIVIGRPVLKIHCRETTGADRYSFTAILGEMPPDPPDDKFWPVTSERFYFQTDPGEWNFHEFELDTVVHEFQDGNRICLILSPFSIPLEKHLMFCPNMQDFEIEMSNYRDPDPAIFSLPVMSLTEAPLAWQIYPADYHGYRSVEGDEWQEALGEYYDERDSGGWQKEEFEFREQADKRVIVGGATRTR